MGKIYKLIIVDSNIPKDIIWPHYVETLWLRPDYGKIDLKKIPSYANVATGVDINIQNKYINFKDISHINIDRLECDYMGENFIGFSKDIDTLYLRTRTV